MSSTGTPKRLRAVYYRDQDGSEPVSDFIEALPVKQQVALDSQIDRMNELCRPPNPLSRIALEGHAQGCGYRIRTTPD